MTTAQSNTSQNPTKPAPSKAAIVKRLLSRKTGATLEEIGAATNWQPHSIRAFLSGLRKKDETLAREERRDGAKAYRLAPAQADGAARS